MKANSILEVIANTPHVRINKLFPRTVEVWLKLERQNPGGSIKDRIALSMVEDAERSGALKPGTTIIEPTSGNTGIGLAMVAAVKNYPLILVMPESMSIERRRLMDVYGARLELTPKEKGMKGSIERAQQLLEEISPSWMPMQFDNEANLEIHRRTTAVEIVNDFPEGLDYLITGVGTGGHITACAEVVKHRFPAMQVYAVEPTKSPILSGGTHSPHKIQGIGAGFVPKIMNVALLDGVLQVEDEKAFEFADRLAKEEGIFAGISTGACLAAINKKIPEMPEGSRVLGFNYDTGERYLSVEGLYPSRSS